MENLRTSKISDRHYLVRKCDDLWSLIVRAVDGNCVTCGATQHLQCGHLWSRTSYTTRYHPRNSWGQCAACNNRHEHDAHSFNAFYLDRYGRDSWDELHSLSANSTNVKNWQLVETYNSMLELWKGMQKCPISRTRLDEASLAWIGFFSPSSLPVGSSTVSS